MAGGMTVLMFRCVLVCIWLKLVLAYEKCEKINACSCLTDEGEISLWRLASRGDRPRFARKSTYDPRLQSFSWNPCIPYSFSKKKGSCQDAAACVQRSSYYYAVAKQDSATCMLSNTGQCALKYTGKKLWSLDASLTVTLRCDKSEEGRVDTINVQTTYSFIDFDTVLHSKYACVKAPPVTPPPKPSSPSEDSSSGNSASSQNSGLSLGSKLIITFFCIFVAYIIFGTLINKYGRHMEGKEAFPNYSFWLDLPNLIKEGCSFTFYLLRKLCGRGSDGSSYASI